MDPVSARGQQLLNTSPWAGRTRPGPGVASPWTGNARTGHPRGSEDRIGILGERPLENGAPARLRPDGAAIAAERQTLTAGVEQESDVEFHDRALYRCASCAAGCGRPAPRAREPRGALGDQGRPCSTSCCTVDRPVHGMRLQGYFLTDTDHGTRHVPWCQTVQPERANRVVSYLLPAQPAGSPAGPKRSESRCRC